MKNGNRIAGSILVTGMMMLAAYMDANDLKTTVLGAITIYALIFIGIILIIDGD